MSEDGRYTVLRRKRELHGQPFAIGEFAPPRYAIEAPVLSPEQQEAERKKAARREREREPNRLRMQRVRATKKAALLAEDATISSSALQHIQQSASI